MNKLNWIKLILFAACFTFGISLLLINSYSSLSTVLEGDFFQKKSQLFGSSGNDNENHENVSSETGQGVIVSYDTDIEEERALLIERNEQNTSRGSEIRTKEVKPAAPAEVKPVAPTEVKPAAPKEVKPAPPASAVPEKASEAKQITPDKAEAGASNDLDLLARLITAEAQGEPYEAKVAVGAVVMNRVESNSWPNTIKDVIYQNINGYYQFSPVVNGWINKPAQPESIEAAKAALSGADPTNGAQFYYDDTTTNPWILEKPVSIKIGHMIYAF